MLRLFFIFATGCSACAAAKVDLQKFMKAHPEIPLTMVDLTETEWPENIKYQPEVVPAYVLHRRHSSVIIKEGGMSYAELEDWVRRKASPTSMDIEEIG